MYHLFFSKYVWKEGIHLAAAIPWLSSDTLFFFIDFETSEMAYQVYSLSQLHAFQEWDW